jgi:hypothetical protein
MVLHGLDDDDRIVDDETDREDQAEERQVLMEKPSSGKIAKADQR